MVLHATKCLKERPLCTFGWFSETNQKCTAQGTRSKQIRIAGLEPARLEAIGPKPIVFTNSTIPAWLCQTILLLALAHLTNKFYEQHKGATFAQHGLLTIGLEPISSLRSFRF